MTEWEVWYTEGRCFTSVETRWEDLPYHGVLVVRAWFANGNQGVVFGDGVYGHPDTWKGGTYVSNEEYRRVFEEAQATVVPPSQRV